MSSTIPSASSASDKVFHAIESEGPYTLVVESKEVTYVAVDPSNIPIQASTEPEQVPLHIPNCNLPKGIEEIPKTTSSWRNVTLQGATRAIASTVFSSVASLGTPFGYVGNYFLKKYNQWKFTEENWGKKSDWVPDIVKNRLITHFSKKVKEALNQKAEQNRQTILNCLIDPDNFKKCESIIVDYFVSFITSKKESINKSLGQNAFEKYKFHDPELIRGFLLRIFMASVPPDGSKISSEQLLTNGVIEVLSGIQNLSDAVENELKFVRNYRKQNVPIPKSIEKQLQKSVQDQVEIFLSKYFPNKEAEFGSWFSTGLVRGGIWSSLAEGITAIFYSYEKMRQKSPDPSFVPSPLLANLEIVPKINSFAGSCSEHVMAFIKSSFKDPETIEEMLQGLKGVVCSNHFQENHPETFKGIVRNIVTSKDPKVRQLFTRALGYIEYMLVNFINNEAKNIESLIGPVTAENSVNDETYLSRILENGLESIFGDIYNLFSSIKSKSNPLNFDEILRAESKKFLEKRFPNKYHDFPCILRFLLGGNEKSWLFLIEKFTSIVLKFYRPIFEQPTIFEEYKRKLRDKIHDDSDPEATPVNIQRAIDISQGIANDIFDGIFQKLTKTTKDEKGRIIPLASENEFEDIEKLFQILKPEDESNLPDKHPNEVLQGFKNFLLSKKNGSVNIQNALRNYLGELVFKASVNLIYEADNDPDNPCPKYLLIAKGFRHLLSLLCVNPDMTDLHHYIKKEKPLPLDPLERKKAAEDRFLERKKFIYGENGKPPRLVNHLLKTLFPDLPRHIPLIPSLNKKLCLKIEKDLAPEFIIANYEKSILWINELSENEQYIENFVKEGPPEKREFGRRVLDNCEVVSQFILDLVPNMFETDSQVFGEMLYLMLKDYLPPLKDSQQFITFLSANFKVLGNPRDRVIIETQSCLKNYIYSACVKFYVQALRKVESLGKDLDNFTVTDLVNMCLEELNNFIQPLNVALNDYNSRRLFTRVRHISQLPPEEVNRALNLPNAKRTRLVDGKFVEQNEVSLHPSLSTEGIANSEQAALRKHHRLYLPIASGIINFCDLANPALKKPLPDAIEGKVWTSITTKGVPKFVEWLMNTLNNDATKTGLIYTLISKFENDLELRKNAVEDPASEPLPDSSVHPLSDESKKTLRKCVKTVIQLAPQNLLIFAYKYFPDVKEKINERLEDALTDFLAKFTLVDLLDLTISGVTSSIKERGEYDRYTHSYRFKFPTTSEEVAADQAKKVEKMAEAERKAREGLLNIVEGGIRAYRKRQWDSFVDSTAQKIHKGLEGRFYGIGDIILFLLEFFYEYIVLKIINFIFSRPLKSVVSFFDRLFARYIRQDIEPQIRIVSMPGVDSLVNNVMTRGFEILNTTQERAAAEENAKGAAKKVDEIVRETLPIHLNRRASV